jgi:uncharacterized cupredoxin-like copper-binding protein
MRSAVVALALFVLACPPHGGNEEHAGGPQTSTTTTNPQAVPENSTRMNPVTESAKDNAGNRVASAPLQVPVDLTEYSINMPELLTAGPQQLQITNHGEQQHGFAIEGGAVHQHLTSNLTKGGTATLDVDLPPGTYDVYCPVDGHKGKGMRRTVTVK